jgi:hypothetical protein
MSELPLLLEKFILDLISESTLSNTFMEEMEEEEQLNHTTPPVQEKLSDGLYNN